MSQRSYSRVIVPQMVISILKSVEAIPENEGRLLPHIQPLGNDVLHHPSVLPCIAQCCILELLRRHQNIAYDSLKRATGVCPVSVSSLSSSIVSTPTVPAGWQESSESVLHHASTAVLPMMTPLIAHSLIPLQDCVASQACILTLG